jgi:hypothetical protein
MNLMGESPAFAGSDVGVERVVPSRVIAEVEPSFYERVAGSAQGLKDVVVNGVTVSGYRVGDVCRLAFDSKDYQKVFVPDAVVPEERDQYALKSIVPAEGARFVPMPAEMPPFSEVVFYRVVDAAKFSEFFADRVPGTYVPEGALFHNGDDVAILSTKNIGEPAFGFGQFLDHLKGRELTSYSAKLAPADGRVIGITPLGTQRGISEYVIEYQAMNKEKSGEINVKLPAGHCPSVQVGQFLDAGDPMTFGYVKLTERAALRPKFREELSNYLYSYYYDAGKNSMWSAHLELLARSLVQPSKDGDKFVPLGKAYKGIGDQSLEANDVRLSRSYDSAARLGNLDPLFQSAFLGVDIVSSYSDANAPIFKPGQVEDVEKVYPLHLVNREQAFVPGDVGLQGKRVVREIADAVGIGL